MPAWDPFGELVVVEVEVEVDGAVVEVLDALDVGVELVVVLEEVVAEEAGGLVVVLLVVGGGVEVEVEVDGAVVEVLDVVVELVVVLEDDVVVKARCS